MSWIAALNASLALVSKTTSAALLCTAPTPFPAPQSDGPANGPAPSAPPSFCSWVDYDGDGWLDATVSGRHGLRLMRGLGEGRFEDVTEVVGLANSGIPRFPHSARWADFDQDGREDLFLGALGEASVLLRQTERGSLETVPGLEGLSPVAAAEWVKLGGPGGPDLWASTLTGEVLLRYRGGSFHAMTLDFGGPFFKGAPFGDLQPGSEVADRGTEGHQVERSALRADAPLPVGEGREGSGNLSGTVVPVPNQTPAFPFATCASNVEDAANPGTCLPASSLPLLGALFPLGTDLFVDPSGRVGMGTLTPQRSLHIAGTTSRRLRLDSAIHDAGIELLSDGTGAVALYTPDGSEDLRFYAGGNDRMTVDDDGQVGIGTIAPDRALDVAGRVRSRNGGFEFPDATVQETASSLGNTVDAGEISAGAVTSATIANFTINNTDIATNASIAGSKVAADFSGQDVIGDTGEFDSVDAGGSASFPVRLDGGWTDLDANLGRVVVRGVTTSISNAGRIRGYLGVRGYNDFDGVPSADWAIFNSQYGMGVVGIANEQGEGPQFGVMGHAGFAGGAGVRGEYEGGPSANWGELGKDGVGMECEGTGIGALATSDTGFGLSAITATGTAVRAQHGGNGRLFAGFGPTGGAIFEVLSTGRVVTTALEITGGGDLVEGFDTGEVVCEPGTVVVIDPQHAGQLIPSSQPYDTKVAGVVSGAGGVAHGIRMGQDGVLDGDTLVAMTGRVHVWCSAENGPIQPGDRLTTAGLPGHAMRASDAQRCDGAVLGKAMSSLTTGTGLVLVLVNLQ